jgi:cytochrome c5
MKATRHATHVLLLALWMALVWTGAGVHGPGMAAPLPAAGQSPEQAVGSEQAQIEKGRVTVSQVCVGCHAGIMRMLEVKTQSREEWRDTVHSMIGRGALVLPDEIEPLVAYLVTSAGRGRPQASAPAAAARTGQGTPGAQAHVILQQRCRICHDLELATTKPESEDWDAVLDRMATLGASLTPAERQTLIEHLDGLER